MSQRTEAARTDAAPGLRAKGERTSRGRDARARVSRSSHAAWDPPSGRADPVDVLESQAATRVPELVPIRYGRMLASPFAFYRGAAAIMAADLASTPTTGIRVQLAGDAHLSNFGGFASPDRDLVFDVNDFDETLPGPWEWDVKRLAASAAVAGRERGYGQRERRDVVAATVRQYRQAMAAFAGMSNLGVWYARLDMNAMLGRWRKEESRGEVKSFRRLVSKAHTKDSMRAFDRLTHVVDGEPRIVSDPPLLVPIREMLSVDDQERMLGLIRGLVTRYRRTLQADRRHLLDEFRLVDLAQKVVGVGSVGTRSWIVLFLGFDGAEPLFLQAKEAQPSVLAPFAGKSRHANQGQRVVDGQRLMQATSDILLGWDRVVGLDGEQRDFYIRQLWDWKLSADVEGMSPEALRAYGEACGWTLARAHARTGDRVAIAAYLGGGDTFDSALVEFAEAYADQNERDFGALQDAVKAGRVEARQGV
jgi:uncharacterized protein (DUF2252 family)